MSKERSIIFSGPMVRAIIEDRKTQTRRVIRKPKQFEFDNVYPINAAGGFWWASGGFSVGVELHCPYGQPHDNLWVRETWAPFGDAGAVWFKAGIPQYRAGLQTGEWLDFPYKLDNTFDPPDDHRWKPSIHMPRWASRINLEIKDVRVERLQDINGEDAQAEGVTHRAHTPPTDPCPTCAQAQFYSLWDSINAKRGYAWNTNPWVWVIEFYKI